MYAFNADAAGESKGGGASGFKLTPYAKYVVLGPHHHHNNKKFACLSIRPY